MIKISVNVRFVAEIVQYVSLGLLDVRVSHHPAYEHYVAGLAIEVGGK